MQNTKWRSENKFENGCMQTYVCNCDAEHDESDDGLHGADGWRPESNCWRVKFLVWRCRRASCLFILSNPDPETIAPFSFLPLFVFFSHRFSFDLVPGPTCTLFVFLVCFLCLLLNLITSRWNYTTHATTIFLPDSTEAFNGRNIAVQKSTENLQSCTLCRKDEKCSFCFAVFVLWSFVVSRDRKRKGTELWRVWWCTSVVPRY